MVTNKELMENINEIKEELKKKNKDIEDLVGLINYAHQRTTKSGIMVFIISYGLVYMGFHYTTNIESFAYIGGFLVIFGVILGFIFPMKWLSIKYKHKKKSK